MIRMLKLMKPLKYLRQAIQFVNLCCPFNVLLIDYIREKKSELKLVIRLAMKRGCFVELQRFVAPSYLRAGNTCTQCILFLLPSTIILSWNILYVVIFIHISINAQIQLYLYLEGEGIIKFVFDAILTIPLPQYCHRGL